MNTQADSLLSVLLNRMHLIFFRIQFRPFGSTIEIRSSCFIRIKSFLFEFQWKIFHLSFEIIVFKLQRARARQHNTILIWWKANCRYKLIKENERQQHQRDERNFSIEAMRRMKANVDYFSLAVHFASIENDSSRKNVNALKGFPFAGWSEILWRS